MDERPTSATAAATSRTRAAAAAATAFAAPVGNGSGSTIGIGRSSFFPLSSFRALLIAFAVALALALVVPVDTTADAAGSAAANAAPLRHYCPTSALSAVAISETGILPRRHNRRREWRTGAASGWIAKERSWRSLRAVPLRGGGGGFLGSRWGNPFLSSKQDDDDVDDVEEVEVEEVITGAMGEEEYEVEEGTDASSSVRNSILTALSEAITERVRTAASIVSDFRTRLWLIPVFGAVFWFCTFRYLSATFHAIVQWASQNTWIPSTHDELTLQANVVTQVVNGPVITSISVLFATLVSMTVSQLHSKQVEIQNTYVREIAALRELEHLLESSSTSALLGGSGGGRGIRGAPAELLTMARACVQLHADQLLLREINKNRGSVVEVTTGGDIGDYDMDDDDRGPRRGRRRRRRGSNLASVTSPEDAHHYIESDLLLLQDCINEMHASTKLQQQQQQHGRGIDNVLSQLQSLTHRLLTERSNRWLAMQALNFPAVHYITLSVLAASIGVSFLVATDEAEFIFLRGLPVRILWTLLATSFTALAVLCYDLSRPFGGAYRVEK